MSRSNSPPRCSRGLQLTRSAKFRARIHIAMISLMAYTLNIYIRATKRSTQLRTIS